MLFLSLHCLSATVNLPQAPAFQVVAGLWWADADSERRQRTPAANAGGERCTGFYRATAFKIWNFLQICHGI
jgi:hypothetical protein